MYCKRGLLKIVFGPSRRILVVAFHLFTLKYLDSCFLSHAREFFLTIFKLMLALLHNVVARLSCKSYRILFLFFPQVVPSRVIPTIKYFFEQE